MGDIMKLGLCLSGGGIKGVAHIGAIKAMEEENIHFDAIAGTSSGSIVATLLACGYSSDQIYSFFKKYAKSISYIDFRNIFKIIFSLIFKRKLLVNGLNSGVKIEKFINEACNEKNIYDISNIKKELLIPTVDSKSGKVFIFNSCNLKYEDELEKYIPKVNIGRAVRASCTYPVIFSPCPYKEENLLDGGIKENVPYKELKKIKCDKIISINFYTHKEVKCCDNVLDIAFRAFDLMNEELTRYELENISFLHTLKLENVSLLDTKKMPSLYQDGYLQTKRNIKKIKEYIDK